MHFSNAPIALVGRTLLLALFLAACSTSPNVSTTQPEIERQEQPSVEIATAPEPLDIKKAEIDYLQALNAMQAGDRELAERLFFIMTEKYPTLSGPYVNLGLLYQRKEQLDAAEKRFRQAIKVNPENSIAYNQLGILLRNKGLFKESLKMYQSALELDGGYALAHLNIGILFDLYLAEPAKALDHYRLYQKLTVQEDQQVAFWIVDLEQRLQPEISQAGGGVL